MSFLGNVARTYIANRLIRGARQPRRRGGYGYGSPYGRRGRAPRSGFGMRGPFPTYSRRSRGGSSVTVSGCCLPIPLALAVGAAVAARQALRH